MSLRTMRACMVCSIVQAQAKFSREGCPNCEEFLELRGNGDAIADATSSVFEGLVTMADNEVSWVARWQRLQGYVPGLYAVKVVGVVSAMPESCRGFSADVWAATGGLHCSSRERWSQVYTVGATFTQVMERR